MSLKGFIKVQVKKISSPGCVLLVYSNTKSLKKQTFVKQAGGAYVPLDPAYPQARLEFMVKDAGVTALLTTAVLAKALQWPETYVCSALPLFSLLFFSLSPLPLSDHPRQAHARLISLAMYHPPSPSPIFMLLLVYPSFSYGFTRDRKLLFPSPAPFLVFSVVFLVFFDVGRV